MKAGTAVAVGIGAVVLIGGGVGAYFLIRKRGSSAAIDENRALAAIQSTYGAKAAATLSSATPAAANKAANTGVVGTFANAYIPGSGAAADKVSKAVVSSIKKLKFW